MVLSSNVLGLLLSYAGVFAIIGAAQLLIRTRMSGAAARKLVHIGVSHWWLLALVMFDSVQWAVIGPVTFVAINALSYRYGIFRAMEHPEKRRNLGTIYFPISLIVVTVLVFGGPMPTVAGTAAILCLGWGDGLGALAGEHIPAYKGRVRSLLLRRLTVFGGSTKTAAGSISVFIGAGVVSALVFGLGTDISLAGVVVAALTLGLLTTAVEFFTPYGLDNIAIPLAVAFAAWALIDVFSGQAMSSQPGLNAVVMRGAIFGTAPGGTDVHRLLLWLGGLVVWPLVVNLVIAAAAWKIKSVSGSGAAAGIIAGTLLTVLAGWGLWLLLMWFFLSSSLIGRLRRTSNTHEHVVKRGARRDWVQVLANVGVPLAAAVLLVVFRDPVFFWAAAAGFTAAVADTWSSELGILSSQQPLLITSLGRKSRQTVQPGISGGVTVLGSLGGGIGAVTTAGLAVVIGRLLLPTAFIVDCPLFIIFWLLLGMGLFGTLLDSLLGATVQARYRDIRTGESTERPGTHNPMVGGWKWFNNDMVNAVSVFMTMLLMFGALMLIRTL